MAHEIETMAFVGETPWHKLGVYVGENNVKSAEMIKLAGLDWTVATQPLFTCTGPKDQGGKLVRVNDHFAVVRDSDGAVLGIVGDKYATLQNAEAFAVLDGLVDDGSMRYHTAGSLNGGQRIWALGKIGSAEIVPGDRTDQFILISSSHDGSNATRVIWTQVRVVCANTERMALSSANGDGVSVRHTKSQDAGLKQARRILGLAQENADKSVAFLRALAEKRTTEEQWVKLATTLIPDPEDGASPARAIAKREELTRLIFAGRGQKIRAAKGLDVCDTLYGARNAIVEYTNYHRQSRGDAEKAQERRFDGSIWGGGAKFISRADELLVEMLGNPSDLEPAHEPVDAMALLEEVTA